MTPLQASLWSASQVRDKWAVVIGISNFRDPKILPIRYGADSAIKLGKVFLDPAIGHFKLDHMLLLQQEDATRETIDDVLSNGIARKALPADMIILYISTRWIPAKNGKDIIFCANDTTVADPESTGIDLADTLKKIRRRTQCKNILCLLDLSPISEGVSTTKLLSDAPQTKGQQADIINRLAAQTGISIFSANDLSTSSTQTPFTESSYFARFLMEDLNGSGGGMPLDVFQPAVTAQIHQTVLAEQKVNQLPITAASPDFVGNLAIGAIVGKPKNPLEATGITSKTRIGLDGGQLPIDHPELLSGSGIGTPIAPAATARNRQTVSAASLAPSRKAQTAAPTVSTPASAQSPTVTSASARLTSPALAQKPAAESRIGAEELHPANEAAADSSEKPFVDIDLHAYIADVKRVIQAKWQPPKGLEEHRLMTNFTILKDGTIEQAEVTESSGIAAVDRSALDALKAASPLPALPAGSPPSIQLRYRFAWKVNRK